MARRCDAEYYLAADETVVGLRCVHDDGHDYDHLYMVRWSDPEPAERGSGHE
jgi:hypothetical protein